MKKAPKEEEPLLVSDSVSIRADLAEFQEVLDTSFHDRPETKSLCGRLSTFLSQLRSPA